MSDQKDAQRADMAAKCFKRWKSVDGVHMHCLTERLIGVTPFEFQRSRRVYADVYSKTPEYIVTDDDYLLPDDFDLSAALKIFKESGLSVLSLTPSNGLINPWTPDSYQPMVTDDVAEHHSVGGVRFCVKGHLQKWPPMDPDCPGYDTVHCSAIRAAGGRVGFFKNFYGEHLGEGRSQIWAAHKR